jgi:DNA polymerase-1
MKNKLLIIDGSCLLSTSYYGNLPPKVKMANGLSDEEMQKLYKMILHNSEGKYTNAIYGFFKTLVKLLNERNDITHIAFVFDKSRETLERRNIYPPYKAQRKPTPEPLKEQFISIEKTLENMGFKVFYKDGYEADDFAGSIVETFEKEIDIVLMTKDHDYLQLVSDNTKLWMMLSDKDKVIELREKYCIDDEEIYPDKIFEFNPFITKMEEGVWPEQIPDLKGLMGDASDNIPGVKNLSSAAAPLLSKYQTIENLYIEIEKCENDKKKIKELCDLWKTELEIRNPYNALTKEYDNEYVKNAKESALLSKKLATIKRDIPLDITLDDLEIKVNKTAYLNELNTFSIRSLEMLNEKYFK